MIKPEQRRKKLNTGGNIGEGAGAIVGDFIPGLPPGVGSMIGSQAGRVLGNLISPSKERVQTQKANATMGYKYGGKYKRHLKYPMGGQLPSSATPIGNDAVRYDGPSHEQGGIPIDEAGNPTDAQHATAEVEGNETRQGDFIFSDELMVPDSEMTFAEAHEMLLEQGAGEEQIEQLAQMQEQVKQEQGLDNEGPVDQPQQAGMQDQWGAEGHMNIPMGKGGKVPKYPYGGNRKELIPYSGFNSYEQPQQSQTPAVSDTNKEKSSIDLTSTAQRFLPSVTRLASAAFAPKPKETPKMQAQTISERNPAFTGARNQLASGFRANNTQGGHAQFIQGTNQLASQEAQDRTQREQFNAQSQSRADQMNIQSTARDNERLAQHQAAQIKLIDDAIQGPLNQMVADKRGKEQMKSTLLMASSSIENPIERTKFIQEALALIEGGESMEQAIQKAQMRYGGKIKK